MSLQRTLQLSVSTIIGLMFVGLVYWSAPRFPTKPHGIFLPSKTNTSFTPTDPNTISITSVKPAHFQRLGLIRIEQHYTGGKPQKNFQQMAQLARELAAKAGANQIIVINAGVPRFVAPLNQSFFRGIAIKNSVSFPPLQPGIKMP